MKKLDIKTRYLVQLAEYNDTSHRTEWRTIYSHKTEKSAMRRFCAVIDRCDLVAEKDRIRIVCREECEYPLAYYSFK